MRAFAWIITSLNVLLALRTLFSAIDGNSKYSLGMTWFAGLLFLTLACYGSYALWNRASPKTTLAISIAPWLIFIVVMFLSLVTGSWQ